MTCPTCGRVFKSFTGMRIHQTRTPACFDPEGVRRSQRERDRRRAKRPSRRMPAGYWSRYRREHPDYWARERARLAALGSIGNIAAQAARRAIRRAAEREAARIPPLHTGHVLFDAAVAVVSRLMGRGSLVTLYDPTFDDAVAEAVVAMVAGEDPEARARAFIRSERQWSYVTAPLIDPK